MMTTVEAHLHLPRKKGDLARHLINEHGFQDAIFSAVWVDLIRIHHLTHGEIIAGITHPLEAE